MPPGERKLVPDRLIPPTMLVGHSLPSIMQAFIFLILLGLLVDFVLIVGCALAHRDVEGDARSGRGLGEVAGHGATGECRRAAVRQAAPPS